MQLKFYFACLYIPPHPLFFPLTCKVLLYLSICKICVQVGFISWWSNWDFTIARFTTFHHSSSVNQAKVLLEILLHGAEEKSTSLSSPLYFPSQSSVRWGLLSEEPISANSGGQMATEVCEIFLYSSVFPVLAGWKSEEAVTVKMTMPSDLELMHVQLSQITNKPIWKLEN